jgi:predicted regulator of Ras-like GTPase activity (Roadblock/LC7/MglB family)
VAQLLPTYSEKQIELLGRALQNHLIAKDAQCAALLDLAGSIIVKRDNGRVAYDLESIAVLAASNFSAVKAIAERIGESQFSLMYHKGKKGNVHLNEVMRGFLLVTIFGKEISVGNLRLMVDDTVKQIRKINYYFAQKKRSSRAIPSSPAVLPVQPKRPIVGRLLGRFRKKVVGGKVQPRRSV